jgi:hypothetical protein
MAGIGSGLDTQFGIAIEDFFGVAKTPNAFFEVTDVSATLTPTYLEGSGIRPGKRFKRIAQVGISKVTAAGDVTMPLTMSGMNPWWKLALGSTATAVDLGDGKSFGTTHVPGSTMLGLSATLQVVKSEPYTGNLVPFTYNGCKVTDWELSIADGAETNLKVTIDGVNEVATFPTANASYLAGNDTYNFANVTAFKVGGTPHTSAGFTSIAGGSAVASVVSSLTLKGVNTFDVARFGVGNAGYKSEQIEQDFVAVTGDFAGEFNQAQFYNSFVAGSTVPIEIDMSSTPVLIPGSTRPWSLSIVIPAAKITAHALPVSGPGLIAVSGTFTVYDNEVDPPIQIYMVSTDSSFPMVPRAQGMKTIISAPYVSVV